MASTGAPTRFLIRPYRPKERPGRGRSRGMPRSRRQDEHRDGAEADRDPLQRPQPLTQDDHAEQHREDRVDEVPESRLDHVP